MNLAQNNGKKRGRKEKEIYKNIGNKQKLVKIIQNNKINNITKQALNKTKSKCKAIKSLKRNIKIQKYNNHDVC
jgi:hypothetical protein